MEGDHHKEHLLLNLPSPIITDILSRLPVISIFRCKSVCKTFLVLISEPDFIPLHQARSPVELLIHNVSINFPGFSYLNLVEIEDDPNHHNLHYVEEKEMDVPKLHPDSFMTLVGSINGLVCFLDIFHDAIDIWNPATRECITLETPPGGKKLFPDITRYGFGFSSATNQFHVVRIFQEIDKNDYNTVLKSECHVYTFGTGSWTSIGHAPFTYNCEEHGHFLHDHLHWFIYDNDDEGREFISCLDLEKMRFRAFPFPPELSKEHIATLNTYNGQLCICDNTSDVDIVIWTMKEYGVKDSWSKEVVISKYPVDLVGSFDEVVHVLKVFKDGEILLLWRDDLLLSYHLHRKTLATFDARDLVYCESRERSTEGSRRFPPSIEAMDYVPSFLSLRNFEMEVVKEIQN